MGNQTPVEQGTPPSKGGAWRKAFPDWVEQWSLTAFSHTAAHTRFCFVCEPRQIDAKEESLSLETLFKSQVWDCTPAQQRLVSCSFMGKYLPTRWTLGNAIVKGRWTVFSCCPREITAGHASSHWTDWLHLQRHGNLARKGETWLYLWKQRQ